MCQTKTYLWHTRFVTIITSSGPFPIEPIDFHIFSTRVAVKGRQYENESSLAEKPQHGRLFIRFLTLEKLVNDSRQTNLRFNDFHAAHPSVAFMGTRVRFPLQFDLFPRRMNHRLNFQVSTVLLVSTVFGLFEVLLAILAFRVHYKIYWKHWLSECGLPMNNSESTFLRNQSIPDLHSR